MVANVNSFTVWEDSGISLMARIKLVNGDYIQKDSITSIAYSIFDMSDTSTATSSGNLSINTVIYNTLQTDERWQEDNTGYNFRWDVRAAKFPSGGKRYRLEVKFTPAQGEPFHVVWEVITKELYRS